MQLMPTASTYTIVELDSIARYQHNVSNISDRLVCKSLCVRRNAEAVHFGNCCITAMQDCSNEAFLIAPTLVSPLNGHVDGCVRHLRQRPCIQQVYPIVCASAVTDVCA